jgi:hypothetical protein
MKAVLPETTLIQKVPSPKIESSVQTTDILSARRSPLPLVLPKTSSQGEVVFETETSPEIAGTSDNDVAEGVSKGDVQAFARKSFGTIASPYLSPYVYRRGVLDVEYGIRKIGNRFLMGHSDVTVDSDIQIRDQHFKGTRGLWELLTQKGVDNRLVSEEDLKQYKNILDLTSAHLEGYEPGVPIHISILSKLKLSPSFFLILDSGDSKLHYAKTG